MPTKTHKDTADCFVALMIHPGQRPALGRRGSTPVPQPQLRQHADGGSQAIVHVRETMTSGSLAGYPYSAAT